MAKLDLDKLRRTPAYPFVEGAHYLYLPVSTLRAWCLGQGYAYKGKRRRFKQIIKLDGKRGEGLSFLNLVEAHVLAARPTRIIRPASAKREGRTDGSAGRSLTRGRLWGLDGRDRGDDRRLRSVASP